MRIGIYGVKFSVGNGGSSLNLSIAGPDTAGLIGLGYNDYYLAIGGRILVMEI